MNGSHPTTIDEFQSVYDREYKDELASCNRWIEWCKNQNDTHGMNFYEGMKSAHIYNDIKMRQLIRVLKQESPNCPVERQS